MTETSLIFNLLAIDRVTSVLGGVGKGWSAFGVTVGVAAAYAGDKALKMGGDFQQSMVRLVTGAGESKAALDLVGSGTLEMAGKVGIASNELAKALYIVESGGQHGADALAVLQAAAEGAKAEQADLGTVADAVTSVLADYHLKSSDAALVTSQLVTAVGSGKTNFQLFSQALSSVLPIASSAHIALSDITGDIASMTVHGMSAEQATQNLADAIRHMIAPTHLQTAELAQLGISSSELADMLSSKGLSGTMQYLSQTILQHMGPSGRVMLDSMYKSRDAARDLQAMMLKMPPAAADLARAFQRGAITMGDYRKALKSLPVDQANLVKQFASLQGTASGFNDLLKSGSPAAQTYQDALRRVTGDATGLNVALMLTGENTAYTNETIAKIAASTTEAGNHVKGWAEVQETFNQKMAEASAKVDALGVKIGTALMPVAEGLLDKTMSLVDWFGQHETVTKSLTVAFGSLAAAVLLYKGYTLAANAATVLWSAASGVATAAQWALNVALDANPVGLVVIAIAALVAAIYLLWTHSEGFRKFFVGLWNDDIWPVLKSIGAWFAGPFTNFFVDAWHTITAPVLWFWHAILEPFIGGVEAGIGLIVRVVTSFANLWLYAFEQLIGKPLLWLWHNVAEPVWHGIAAGAMWLWHNAIEPMVHGFEAGMAVVGRVAMWLWHNAIEPAWHGITFAFGKVMSVVHKIEDVFKSVFGAIKGHVVSAFDGAVSIVKNAINGMIGMVNSAVGFINRDVIGKLNNVPGVDFPSIPEIPKLAKGGIVTGPTLALLGEGGHPERVQPLDGSENAGGTVRVVFDFQGADEGFMTWIRSIVRVEGGGNVQVAFGRAGA